MEPNRSLLFHGAVVLVLSLLAGVLVATPGVENPRIALSAHIAGLISGPILLALGMAWPHVRLDPVAAGRTERLLVVSFYLNFASLVLAALFGTSRTTPIAGAGHEGAAWQEIVVALGLGVAVVGVFVALVAVCVGLSRSRAQG